MTEPLQNLLNFSKMLHDFRLVERMYYANGTERRENDTEHSFNLALLAWYIADSQKLDLNKDLLLRYALIHDIPEVHAGDTYIYTKDAEYLASKNDREASAREKLYSDFSEFPDFQAFLEQYLKQEDAESRFVYTLDKLLPIIDIFLDKGRSWQEHKVSLQMLIDAKTPKMKVSADIEKYYNEFLIILKENKEEIFPHDK
ncbi:MAG: HD domain-containing protein [Patescibacteria group bacterium]